MPLLQAAGKLKDMHHQRIKGSLKDSISTLFWLCLLLHTPMLYAQAEVIQVEPRVNSPGFRYVKHAAAAEPLIYYRQIIELLSPTNDMPSLKIFGNGHVEVHFPVYMKKAGDYEMYLDDSEVIELIRTLAHYNIMRFDHQAVSAQVSAIENAHRAQGRLHHVSDAVISIIEIKLLDYRENSAAQITIDFHKKIQWTNLEHDVKRYPDISGIADINYAVSNLQALMHDSRLLSKPR
jgi:hypothetical protein